jgi:hypothetical protein
MTVFNSNKTISLPHISSAAYQCMIGALKEANCILIQPVMRVQVSFVSLIYWHSSIEVFVSMFELF